MASELPVYVLDVLNRIAISAGFIDYTFETDAGSTAGDGMNGIMVRLIVTGTKSGSEATEKLHLLCKLAPENAARRKEFKTELMFDREVYAYNKWLPLLTEFQREKGLSDDEGFFCYPKCYAAVADTEKEEFFIILEDLKARQFTMWPKQEPIAKNHIYKSIEHLAKYHAISFALRDQRPEVFESLRVLKDFLAEFFESGNFVKMMYSGYELAETVLKDPAHVRIMKDVREKFFEILHSCVDAGVSEPFSVIGHGDFQINNIMWLYTDAKVS